MRSCFLFAAAAGVIAFASSAAAQQGGASSQPAPLPPVTLPTSAPGNEPAVWCVMQRQGPNGNAEQTVIRCDDSAGAGPGWMPVARNLTFTQASQIRDGFNNANLPRVWCVMRNGAQKTVIRCDNTAGAGPGWTLLASNLTFPAASAIRDAGLAASSGPPTPPLAGGAPPPSPLPPIVPPTQAVAASGVLGDAPNVNAAGSDGGPGNVASNSISDDSNCAAALVLINGTLGLRDAAKKALEDAAKKALDVRTKAFTSPDPSWSVADIRAAIQAAEFEKQRAEARVQNQENQYQALLGAARELCPPQPNVPQQYAGSPDTPEQGQTPGPGRGSDGQSTQSGGDGGSGGGTSTQTASAPPSNAGGSGGVPGGNGDECAAAQDALAKARQRLNDAALAAAVYSVDKPGEKLPPEGLAVLHAAQLIAQASKQLIPQLEAKAQKACSKQQTASAPPPAQPPAGGGAPPPLPPIAMNTPPQYPPAQPPPPGGSSGGTGSPGAPACTQPPPPPAYPPCSSFPGAKQYTCTRKKADGSPDPEYHCLYPDAVPEAARICGQASDPKYAGKWTEGGSPPPAAANAQCSTPPKVYADLNLKPPAAEVQACESKPPFLPWGGHGSATITVSGGKPCGIGWHDTGATILDSMSVSSSPSHGSLKPQDQHVIVFTPAPGYKGQDSFTLSMKEHNGGRRATMSVKVSVTIQ